MSFISRKRTLFSSVLKNISILFSFNYGKNII
nr:MAG TPA: hypothetical protein [Caudoviricetes sp.]